MPHRRAGAVAENTQVSLKTATEGAAIYYTTDGSTPTTASNVYDSTNPFVISKNTTIKALAVKDKMESEVVTFAYTVSEKLSTPQASIESGSVVAAGTVVTLTRGQWSDHSLYHRRKRPEKNG